MSEVERKKFEQKVSQIFPDEEYPQNEIVVVPDYDFGVPSHPEMGFKDKDRRTLTPENIFIYREDLPFLTPVGFHYFFPALLKIVLLFPDQVDTLLDNLVSALIPPSDKKPRLKEYFMARVKTFNRAEKRLILEFLEQYEELYSEPDWELRNSEKKRLQHAVLFWRGEVTPAQTPH